MDDGWLKVRIPNVQFQHEQMRKSAYLVYEADGPPGRLDAAAARSPPARAKIHRPSDRVGFEDRVSFTAAYSSIVHCHQPLSLVLRGKGQHKAPWGFYIRAWSATAQRIRTSARKVIGTYKSETNIPGNYPRTHPELQLLEVHSWLRCDSCGDICGLGATLKHSTCFASQLCRNDIYGRLTNLDKTTTDD
jgi:hypothetical protein